MNPKWDTVTVWCLNGEDSKSNLSGEELEVINKLTKRVAPDIIDDGEDINNISVFENPFLDCAYNKKRGRRSKRDTLSESIAKDAKVKIDNDNYKDTTNYWMKQTIDKETR